MFVVLSALNIKAQQIVPPTEAEKPQLEYAFQLYVTLEPEYVVGEVPHGKRVVIPITGGIFSAGEQGFYFLTAPKFEAPEDSRYAWLNNAIFVCSPAQSDPNTIRLNIWKVVR